MPETDALAPGDLLAERGRPAERDHSAVIDQRDPVAQPLRLLHQVGDEQDRHATVAHPFDQLPGVAAGLGVEPGGQLVEHRDFRPADQGQHDRQPLLLAARQLPEVVVARRLEPERGQQLAPVRGPAVERGVQLHRLAHPHPVGQRAVLELDADALVELVPVAAGVEAEHADRAAVGGAQARDALDRRGLAGAVAAEDAEDLPGAHREAHVVHGDRRAVRLVQMGDVDHRRRRELARRRRDAWLSIWVSSWVYMGLSISWGGLRSAVSIGSAIAE